MPPLKTPTILTAAKTKTASDHPPSVTQQLHQAQVYAQQALRLVALNMPWLSPLVYAVRVSVDTRVLVAAISPSGRLLVNPQALTEIPAHEAMFIMAHELLHLALDTVGRRGVDDDPSIVNLAHDYIINDLLREELDMSPPLGGLTYPGAADWSLEQMMAWIGRLPAQERPSACWWQPSIPSPPPPDNALACALRQAFGHPPDDQQPAQRQPAAPDGWEAFRDGMDVIFPDQESALFADADSRESAVPPWPTLAEVRAAARQCLALRTIAARIADCEWDLQQGYDRGNRGSNEQAYREALHSASQSPWQRVLQHWLEAITPTTHTYARPSRRGVERGELVLPGRKRKGQTLHVVLDTSASMSDELALCLGAIADFCAASEVSEVHLLQCDAQVTVDEWVAIEDLEHYRIVGFGGSDLSPALYHLAEDQEVNAILVLTDGEIDFPDNLPGIEVLWILTGKNRGYFRPSYGTVLSLQNPQDAP